MKRLKIVCYILAVLCLIFAVLPIFHRVFHIGNLVLIIIGLLLFLLPLFIKKAAQKVRLRRGIIITYSLVFSGMLVLGILMGYQAYFSSPPLDNQPYTLVVLGCKVNGMTPSRMLRGRLDAAYDYLVENPSATVIVTGGQGADEDYPEGFVMASYLINRGISPDRVIAETSSTNTFENLTYAKALLPTYSAGVVIVSDNFHQLRAKLIAEPLNFNPIYSISSMGAPGLFPAYLMRDMGGVVLTWISSFFTT